MFDHRGFQPRAELVPAILGQYARAPLIDDVWAVRVKTRLRETRVAPRRTLLGEQESQLETVNLALLDLHAQIVGRNLEIVELHLATRRGVHDLDHAADFLEFGFWVIADVPANLEALRRRIAQTALEILAVEVSEQQLIRVLLQPQFRLELGDERATGGHATAGAGHQSSLAVRSTRLEQIAQQRLADAAPTVLGQYPHFCPSHVRILRVGRVPLGCSEPRHEIAVCGDESFEPLVRRWIAPIRQVLLERNRWILGQHLGPHRIVKLA